MRKFLMAIAFMLLLPAGVAMAMSAVDKKDDKKDKDKDKGHQPIVIIIWEPAWPIVFREAQPQSAAETYVILDETEL